MYIDKLDDIVNEYNNAYQKTIKMKPTDGRTSTHIDAEAGKNDKDPKFKGRDRIIISKHRNIFAKG